jgi:hypothetical protein
MRYHPSFPFREVARKNERKKEREILHYKNQQGLKKRAGEGGARYRCMVF